MSGFGAIESRRMRLEEDAKTRAEFHDHDLHLFSVQSARRSSTACRRCGRKVEVDSMATTYAEELVGEALSEDCDEGGPK